MNSLFAYFRVVKRERWLQNVTCLHAFLSSSIFKRHIHLKYSTPLQQGKCFHQPETEKQATSFHNYVNVFVFYPWFYSELGSVEKLTSWASLSIQHPISKRGHSWRMEKDRSGQMLPNLFIPCLEDLVLSLKIMEAIQSTRFSSLCCGVYSFLHHPNLSKTEKCVI